jgi:hypothetical protein
MAEGDGDQVGWFDDLVEAIRLWHDAVIRVGGGGSGENTARLLGACGRPFQGFGTESFYPSDIDIETAVPPHLDVPEVATWLRRILADLLSGGTG